MTSYRLPGRLLLVSFVVLALTSVLPSANALQTQWSLPIGPAALSVQTTVVDWDNDGRSDALVSEPNRLRVFNGATGSLQWEFAPGNPPASAFGVINILDVGLNRRAPVDVDGDGSPDLLCAFTDWSGPSLPTTTLRLYDLQTKALKWERLLDGLSFRFLVTRMGLTTKQSIVIRSDAPLVTVMDGASGEVIFTKAITHDADFSALDWDNNGTSELFLREGNVFTVLNAVGSSIWEMTVTSPVGFGTARGPFNLKRADFNRYVLNDVNADGHADVVLEFSAFDPTAENPVVTNIFQLYDLKNKALKWEVNVGMRQTIAIAEFAKIDRSARQAMFTSSLDDSLGGYIVNVIEGVNGRVRWTRLVSQPPTIFDLENDGFADVAVQDGQGLTVYDGASGKLKLQFASPIAGNDLLNIYSQETGLNSRGPVDFNGDGKADLATIQDGSIQLYELTTGLWKGEQTLPDASGRTWMDLGQADNDSRNELFILTAPVDTNGTLFPTLTVIDGQ
jgi:hypothetical protein